MQARATATSTASRSHSTSDHLLSVVAVHKKLALFARFEKPARFLVSAQAPADRCRVAAHFGAFFNDLWVVVILMYELSQKCRNVSRVGGAMLLQTSDFYGEMSHVDCKHFHVRALPRDHGVLGAGHIVLLHDDDKRDGAR